VKGNQGTPFLDEVSKIFYCCRKTDMPLQADFQSSSSTIRTLIEEEVLELIEGPRKEVLPDAKRGKVKASKDGKIGWITVKDRHDIVYAEPNPKLYICKEMVAMTDGQDIMSCKVLRKLAVGEFFEASGPVVEDTSTGVSRLPGKALKDDKDGWITMKGNAGTNYVEAAAKYYTMKKESDLEKQFQPSGSQSIRKMEVGEAFQMLEGPRDEKVQPETRVKVRCVSDGKEGWISKKGSFVKAWSPTYKCVDKLPMHETRTSATPEEAKVLRELQKGESVEMIEGPFVDEKDIKMQCRAVKDGLIGWVTIKSAAKRLLEN